MVERVLTTVKFDDKLKFHIMVQWSFAYRTARKGTWEQLARDRDRFQRKINYIGSILEPILTAEHRKSKYYQTFNKSE